MKRYTGPNFKTLSVLSVFIICASLSLKANAQSMGPIYINSSTSLETALTSAGTMSGNVEIRIAPGQYDGSFVYENINVTSQTLTISGGWTSPTVQQNQSPTTLNGQPGLGPVLFIQNWDDFRNINIVIDGIQIQNGSTSDDSYAAAGLEIGLHRGSITLKNSIITNNEYGGATGAGGAYFETNGTVTIQNNTITGNKTPNSGGGISVGGEASVTMANNTISNNESIEGGGGIYIHTDVVSVSMTNNTIRQNNSGEGAGVWIYRNDGLAKITLHRNTISYNTASDKGGGINCSQTSGEISQNNTIEYNTARYGGGILVQNSTLTIDGNNITNNDALSIGGGLHLEASAFRVTNNDISNNKATDLTRNDGHGGGISIFGCVSSSSSISGNTISRNGASRSGGAIYLEGVDSNGSRGCQGLTISINTISRNEAGYDGGGIYYQQSESVISRNTITGNTCTYWGGGICIYESGGEIVNNIIAGNTANQHGGGVSYYNGSTATLMNNTIALNTSTLDGGGIYCSDSSTATVVNTIVWGNTPDNLIVESGSVANVSYCIIDPVYAGTGNSASNPMLDSGYKLTQSSPMDNGIGTSSVVPNVDIDGEARPNGSGVDIGADEFTGGGTTPVNLHPIAFATAPQTADPGELVMLNGSGSYDPENGTLDYEWTQSPGPSVTLSDENTASASFTVDQAHVGQTLVFQLTVTDNQNLSAITTVSVTINSGTPPLSDAPPTLKSPDDRAIVSGSQLTLEVYDLPSGYSKTIFPISRYDKKKDYSYPDGAVSAQVDVSEGLKYKWQAHFFNSYGNASEWSEEWTFIVGTLKTASMPINPGTRTEDYQMISFPYWPKDPEIEKILGESASSLIDVDIKVGSYYPEDPGYRGYNDGMIVQPGKSFWFLARNGHTILFEGVPVSTVVDIEVPLKVGWNMIACPYDASFNWHNVVVVDYGASPSEITVFDMTGNNSIETCLWAWVNGDYLQTTNMEPRKGYWVKALNDNISLKFPADKRNERSKPRSADSAKTDTGNCDSPPAPISSLNEDSVKDSVGGCFVESVLW